MVKYEAVGVKSWWHFNKNRKSLLSMHCQLFHPISACDWDTIDKIGWMTQMLWKHTYKYGMWRQFNERVAASQREKTRKHLFFIPDLLTIRVGVSCMVLLTGTLIGPHHSGHQTDFTLAQAEQRWAPLSCSVCSTVLCCTRYHTETDLILVQVWLCFFVKMRNWPWSVNSVNFTD